MIILDTDHLSILKYRDGERSIRLIHRLETARITGDQIGTSVVTLEEQMRGWLASLAKERRVHRQVTAYRELGNLIEFFRGFYLVPFDDAAADLFENWNRIRISSTDRKIAAISIVRNALLLTSNRRDYEQIPGLRFENWLDDAA